MSLDNSFEFSAGQLTEMSNFIGFFLLEATNLKMPSDAYFIDILLVIILSLWRFMSLSTTF